MKVFAKSDIGKARETNQDSFYVSQPSEKTGRKRSLLRYCLRRTLHPSE